MSCLSVRGFHALTCPRPCHNPLPRVTSKKGAKALIFERIFGKAEGMPLFKTGGVDDAAPAPAAPGGAAVQRSLVPDSDEWDFDVMVIDVLPGQAAPSVVSERGTGFWTAAALRLVHVDGRMGGLQQHS